MFKSCGLQEAFTTVHNVVTMQYAATVGAVFHKSAKKIDKASEPKSNNEANKRATVEISKIQVEQA